MFLGHFALGFAAKRAAPQLSLGTTFAAAQLLDLVWPVLVLVGVERVAADPGNTRVTGLAFEHYPWSHSLLMAALWGGALALVLRVRGRGGRAALVAGLLVVSHWVLDWVTHRPDLPLIPGAETRLGAGLWNSLPGTLVVEFGLFALGAASYVRATAPTPGPGGRRARWGLVALLGFLVVIYAASLGGQPPPGTPAAAIAGPALAMWLLILWGAWIDRNRLFTLGPGGRTPETGK